MAEGEAASGGGAAVFAPLSSRGVRVARPNPMAAYWLPFGAMQARPWCACAALLCMHVESVPSINPYVKPRRPGPCSTCVEATGRGPITPSEAEVGLRPRACTHVNARGRRPRCIEVHAYPRPRASRGRGMRDTPRPEGEQVLCKDDLGKGSREDKREDRPLVHHRRMYGAFRHQLYLNMRPKLTQLEMGVYNRVNLVYACMHLIIDRVLCLQGPGALLTLWRW
eukprot:365653-Chlamydomonas_euryale.AAC.8